ncbi:sigma-70 family RNA polymerase sigma factor [Glaciecola sp. MH2013]|nr:sigma-70 family RNA polymerase sigma factor [Glaciecola sp. MH2013]
MKEYGALLSRVATTYEANEAIRQELYQEICMACWQALPRFNEDASLKTYLLKIAHNRCISHVAKEANRIKSSDISDTTENRSHDPDPAEASRTASHLSVENQIIQSQKLSSLLTAVRELNITNRQIITLSMEGCGNKEIAEITGLTANNVGVSISRIKSELKNKMTSIESRVNARSVKK